MTIVIRYVDMGGVLSIPGMKTGVYLKSYDPEANDGRGDTEWTDDPDHAMRFDTPGEATDCWFQSPKCRPVRPDGKPNRPLTGFSVCFENAP